MKQSQEEVREAEHIWTSFSVKEKLMRAHGAFSTIHG